MTGIRKETLLKIAHAACTKKNISRDRLAEELGISSMTVGKAVRSLTAAGLITESRDPISRGRHASLVSPSELPVCVCIFMSAQKLTLVAESLAASEITTLSRAINPSVTCRDNLSSIMRELFGLFELENRLVAKATVLLSDKEDLNGFDIASEELYEVEGLAASEIASCFPEENVLYINLSGDALRPLVVSHGDVFSKDGAKKIYTSSQADTARKIAHLTHSLSEYAKIHRVIVEGEANEVHELLYLIKEALLSDFGMTKKEIPGLEYHGRLSFLRKAIFGSLRKAYIESVCDSLFVEQ